MEVFNTVYSSCYKYRFLLLCILHHLLAAPMFTRLKIVLRFRSRLQHKHINEIFQVSCSLVAQSLFVLRGSDVETIKSSLQYPSNTSGLP